MLGDVAARKSASLIAYNAAGDPVARYHLTNAWPAKLQINTLGHGHRPGADGDGDARQRVHPARLASDLTAYGLLGSSGGRRGRPCSGPVYRAAGAAVTNGSRSSSVRAAGDGSLSPMQVASVERPVLRLREPALVGRDAGEAAQRRHDRRPRLRRSGPCRGRPCRRAASHLDAAVDRAHGAAARRARRSSPERTSRRRARGSGSRATRRAASVSTRRACSPPYVTWNSAIAAALGAGGRNLRPNGVAAQLVEQQAARGASASAGSG